LKPKHSRTKDVRNHSRIPNRSTYPLVRRRARRFRSTKGKANRSSGRLAFLRSIAARVRQSKEQAGLFACALAKQKSLPVASCADRRRNCRRAALNRVDALPRGHHDRVLASAIRSTVMPKPVQHVQLPITEAMAANPTETGQTPPTVPTRNTLQ